MTMKSENSKVSGLVLGAATGLATIFAVMPDAVMARGWQPPSTVSEPAAARAEDAAANEQRPFSTELSDTETLKPEQVQPETATSDFAPVVILPPVKPVPTSKNDGAAKATGGEGAKKVRPAAPVKPEHAKAKSLTAPSSKVTPVAPPAVEADDEPPVIISSARKPRPVAAPDSNPAPPMGVNELPEVAAFRALAPATVEPAKPDTAQSASPTLPGGKVLQGGKTDLATFEPGKPGNGGIDGASPIAASSPPAVAPMPAAIADGDKNHTVAEKSPPKLAAAAPASADLVKRDAFASEVIDPDMAMSPLDYIHDAPILPLEPVPVTKAAVKDKPKAKGRNEPQQTGSPKHESKSAPAVGMAKAKPAAEDNAPVMMSWAPVELEAGGKAHGPKAADKAGSPTRPGAAQNTIIGPANVEPAKPELLKQATTPVAVTSAPRGAALAPPPAANPQPQGEANVPAPSDDRPAPYDPFLNVRLLQQRVEGEVMTTQVLPNSTSPEATGQITPVDRTAAGQYCTNIADAAIDARISWQRQNLAEAEKQIAERTQELEVKTAEYQRWLDRRDAFAQKAQKAVVDMYTKMKPDVAALQLQAMDEEMAAALLVKLNARTASAVMNEMEAQKAARLTAIISGSSKGPQTKGRQPPPATGNRS